LEAVSTRPPDCADTTRTEPEATEAENPFPAGTWVKVRKGKPGDPAGRCALKQVYIGGELRTIDKTNWCSIRRNYTVGSNLSGNALDDPDQNFYEHHLGHRRKQGNYNGYCNPKVDKLIDRNPARLRQRMVIQN